MSEELSDHAQALADEAGVDDRHLDFVMDSPSGRALIMRVLGWAGVFSLSYRQNPMDMAFTEGGRNMGLRLMAELNRVCPNKLFLAQQEESMRRSNK